MIGVAVLVGLALAVGLWIRRRDQRVGGEMRADAPTRPERGPEAPEE